MVDALSIIITMIKLYYYRIKKQHQKAKEGMKVYIHLLPDYICQNEYSMNNNM